jgi:SfnB family sulfur acquisition oxidoreductase
MTAAEKQNILKATFPFTPLSDLAALENAERFAKAISPHVAAWDAAGKIPLDIISRFSETGLWALLVPAEFGGPASSLTIVSEVVARISEEEPSLGQLLNSNLHACQYIETAGTDEQKRFFFSKILQGARLGNASSEAGAAHAHDFQTRVIARGDQVVLNGKKAYATGAIYADYISVIAKDEAGQVVTVLVEQGAEGLEFIEDWDGFGQRLTASHSVVLKNVHAPSFNVFNTSTAKHAGPLGAITQLIHAAIDLGIARAAWRDTLTYLRERARPWRGSGADRVGQDPLVLTKVGDLSLKLDTASTMLERSGRLVDRAKAEPTTDSIAAASVAVSQAKILTTEIALQASNELFQLCGAGSTRSKFGFDRHWRNARTHTTHDPVHWRYHMIGNYALNGISPVETGAI